MCQFPVHLKSSTFRPTEKREENRFVFTVIVTLGALRSPEANSRDTAVVFLYTGSQIMRKRKTEKPTVNRCEQFSRSVKKDQSVLVLQLSLNSLHERHKSPKMMRGYFYQITGIRERKPSSFLGAVAQEQFYQEPTVTTTSTIAHGAVGSNFTAWRLLFPYFTSTLSS